MYAEEVRHLSNERLKDLCREQIEVFIKDETSDSRYCYELIRRAVYHIDNADQLVYEIYQPWLQNKIASLCQQDRVELADLTQEAFLRFFQYVTPQTWSRFPSLAHLLAYLSKCGTSVVFIYRRKNIKRKGVEEDIAEAEQAGFTGLKRPPEHELAQRQFRQQFWQCVERNCKDEDDYFLAKQLWLYGMKPRQLVKEFGHRFPKLPEVYKRKRNLVDRIKRDANCGALLRLI